MADGDGGYKYSLCSCFEDCSVCLLVYCCACVAVGELAQDIGDDKWMHCCLSFIIIYFCGAPGFSAHSSYVIKQIREQRGIEGSWAQDCILSWCCGVCYLTQVLREIKDDPQAQVLVRE